MSPPVIERFTDLASRILTVATASRPVLVAVDGPSGSGKTTFAAHLARALNAPVVPIDDFVSWNDFEGMWPRLIEQVVAPFLSGRPITYQQRDWEGDPFGDTLGSWHTVSASAGLILDGVTSSRTEMADCLTYSIWIEAPRPLRLQRGLERDGEELRSRWLDWMEREDAFFTRDGTRERAHLRVKGDSTAVASEDEYEVAT